MSALRKAAERALDALDSKYIVNCGAWRVQRDEAIAALRAALAESEEYRCHMDIEEGIEPDACVLDEGKPSDCVYARKYGDKARDYCGEWKPIKRATS